MTIMPIRPDDPIEVARSYVCDEFTDAFNHLGQAITASVRFVLWFAIYCLLSISNHLRVLDDKWVERRRPAPKEASCQS